MPIFSCPSCATPLQIPEQAEGMILNCPQCEQKLLIPAVNAPPPPKGAFQVARTVRRGPAGPDSDHHYRSSHVHFVSSLSDVPACLSVPKPLFLGLLGALGCLLPAMLFEYPIFLLTPAQAQKQEKVVAVA